ncbi:MAG: beta-propeller fold lactonase family protein [Eubacteriales bacterium]
MDIFVSACAPVAAGGGLYRYTLLPTGQLQETGYFPCPEPMYAVYAEGLLHVLLNAPFAGSADSGVFTVDPAFRNPSALRSTKGQVACHLAVQSGERYIVNYLSGNIVRGESQELRLSGQGCRPDRQEAPHTHCVGFSPDGAYVLATDLGTDTLYVLDREMHVKGSAKVPAGYGIRHFVFSAGGEYVYAVNELVPSVSVFRYEAGGLSHLLTETVPCTHPRANGAAIRRSEDGRYLYVSVREENALYVYRVRQAALQLLQKHPCGGDSPRDFHLSGRLLLCTNEKSDNITAFTLADGRITGTAQTLKAPAPLCVLFVD